jgi:hypothetical protein
MRKYMCLLLFGLLLLVNFRVVEAGLGYGVRANVPFDFYVGNSKMSAGEYTIKQSNYGSGQLLVQKKDGHNSAYAFSDSAAPKSSDSSGKLVFHRYNNEYFLSEIWSGGNETGQVINRSKKELELKADVAQVSKEGSTDLKYLTVTIALK